MSGALRGVYAPNPFNSYQNTRAPRTSEPATQQYLILPLSRLKEGRVQHILQLEIVQCTNVLFIRKEAKKERDAQIGNCKVLQQEFGLGRIQRATKRGKFLQVQHIICPRASPQ